MNTTVVTSLYDIDRKSLDGRDWSSYLDWFSKTLSISNPMVVFVKEDLRDFVEVHREGKPTLVICSELKESIYYTHKERIDEILNDENYRLRIKSPDRIECKSTLYNIIQYSKFHWVETAANLNPFGTENFLWLDAGISRFFEQIDLNRGFGLKGDAMLPGRILLQIFMLSYPDLANATILDESYFWDDRSYVAGGIFMVHRNFANEINRLVQETLTDTLSRGSMNNEQICLGYLIKKNPEMFQLFQHHYTKHRNYELLNILNS